jgi:hypothetical protein
VNQNGGRRSGGRSRLAVALAVAGLWLAGCGSGSTVPATDTTPSARPAQGGASPADFPLGVGNTWVFEDTLLGGTVTQKMTAVGPTAGGTKAVETNTVDFPGSSPTEAAYTYVFHSDGEITYPPAQFAYDASLQGGITWPDPSGLASGRPYRSTVTLRATLGGLAGNVTAQVTVRGAGSASVTVPAGSYQATVVEMTMAINENDMPVTYVVRTWLADGFGPVQYELSATGPGGPSAPPIASGPTGPLYLKLKSFTKG